MNRLLNSLLARQRKLMEHMDELDRPRAPPPARLAPPDPTGEKLALDRSEQLIAQSNWAGAETLLAPYQGRATTVRTLTNLAKIYAQTHRLEEAIDALHEAERLDDEQRKVWMLLARLYAAKKDARMEVVYWRRIAFATENPPVEAYTNLIDALIRSRPTAAPLPAGELKTIVAAFETAPDRSVEDRLAFAQAIYSLSAFRDRAVEMVRAASPCPDGLIDTTASWWRLAQWCQARGLDFRRSDEGVVGHRPTLARVRSAIVDPAFHWIPVLDGGAAVILGLHFGPRLKRLEHAHSPLLLDAGDRVLLRLPQDLPTVQQPALLVGSSDSLHEHLVEHIGALAVAESLGEAADLPLVVGPLSDQQVSLWSALGIQRDRLITVQSGVPTRFDQLAVVTRPGVPGTLVDGLLPRWCRQRLEPELRRVTRAERKVLYLYGDTATSTQVDSDALRTALERAGVLVVDAGQLHCRDLIAHFRSATTVIGTTSGALAFMAFSEPGLRVIELTSKSIGPKKAVLFDHLAAACGHEYASLLCLSWADPAAVLALLDGQQRQDAAA